MTKLYHRIADALANKPVKTVFIAVLALAVMIVGVTQIRMATGNETLVQTDTEAYLSNLGMEENFGSDSIIVLFTADNSNAQTNLKNIQGMWNVHQALEYDEDIFSMMSPASIVHQIASRQFEEIKTRVGDISAGLHEMSEMMTELSVELGAKDIKDPREIEAKLGSLAQATDAFNQLIEVQTNLSNGTSQLQLGLGELATGLGQAAEQVLTLAENAAGSPEMAQQLGMIAGKLNASSLGLADMADKTGHFHTGSAETAKALAAFQDKLNSELAGMQTGLSGGLSPDQLTDMAAGFATAGENLNNIGDALAMFHEKSGMLVPGIPSQQGEVDQIIFEDGEMRPAFANVIPDANNSLLVVKLQGGLTDAEKDAVYSGLTTALEGQEFHDLSYVVSGRPVLDTSLRAEMQANMKSMVAFAVGIMLVILLLVFKVRWRILPLITVFIAVLATLGLMGSVGIPMTMVSMAVFPILIGLGIDYSIQFQSRYEEERSFKATLTQMGPAIGTAVFATMLGFIALFISPVPMIQDFGKMLTIGIVVSYLAGFFFLMPALYIRDKFFGSTSGTERQDRKSSWLEGKLRKLTGGLLKYSVVILVAAVALAAWGTWADGQVGVETDIETFMPQDTPALADLHSLRDVMETTDQVVLYLEDDDVLSQANWTWIAGMTESLETQFPEMVVDVKSVATLVETMSNGENLSHEEAMELIDQIPESQSENFLSPQQDKAVITLGIKHVPVEDIQEFIAELEEYVQGTGMEVGITGKSALDVEMIKGLTSGRTQMTFLGLGLVFLGLLLIYRNFFKAFIPVFPISLIVGLSGGVMQILNLKYTPLTATLGALILGIGTEMTILLLERYIEERRNGLGKVQAMETAVGKIGVAIIASGVTTIGGFGVLMISKFVILKDFGLMTVINVSLALFSTLVVLPSLIFLLDRWLVRPAKEELAS